MGGYIKDWNIGDIKRQIESCKYVITDPYLDGYNQSACKHELYELKCYLEDVYRDLPKFVGEEKWEQERMWEILKR